MKKLHFLLILLICILQANAQNNALEFDGVDDQVSINSHNPTNQISGTALTLEAWIYPYSFNAGGTFAGPVIDKEDDVANQSGYALRVGGTGAFDFLFGTGAGNYPAIASPNNTLVLNKWQHIAGTYDGVNLKLYLNGTLIATAAQTAAIAGSNINLFIGRWASGAGRFFHGMIDEVRIWDVARTQAELQQSFLIELVGNETGLKGYYKLNSASGTTAVNSIAGGAPNGTLTNFPASPWKTLSVFNTWQKSVWLKADAGAANSGANLTGWIDQSGINTFSVVGTPGYQTNLFNFNPAVSFDNTDAVTDLPSSYVHGTTSITYQDGFAVYQKNSGTDGGVVVGSYTKPPGINYGVAIFAGESPNDSYVGNGIVGNYGRFTNTKLATEIGLVNHDVSLATSPFSTARYNGLAQTMTPTGPGFNSINFIPVIGGSKGDWKHMRGKVAEVVLYPTSLSAGDKLKVESYLALKYGITLDPSVTNYVSSAGTAIWNNTTYWNDVFGIGKDDASGLNQAQSNSINTGSGDGTGQSGKGNIVLSNPSAMVDGDFLLIGHDNADLGIQNADLPVSLASKARLKREWKVKRTNDVGTVDLAFSTFGISANGSTASDFQLVIDTDGDGDFSNSTVSKVANSFTNNVVTFTGITAAELADNAVFTFVVGSAVGPGVLGASLWLKANAGTSNSGANLTGWTDQAGINTFTVNGSPGFSTNAINFNPAVSMDNSQANTALPTTYLSGNTTLSYVDGFAVFKKTNAASGALIGSSLTTTNYGAGIFSGESDNQLWVGSGVSFAYQHYTNAALTTGKTVIANFDVGPVSATGRLNGASQTISNGTGAEYANINFIPWIGGSNNSGSTFGWKHFRGQVAEMVLFPSSLSAADKLIIESYLALKYGISLDPSVTDYVSSAGTVLWDNTTYWNDVFGIGKDDASGLNQPQSNSINTGSGDGTGQSGKGNIVLSNPSAMVDGDFLLIGHDNADLGIQNSDLPVSLASKARLKREWKVKRTNDVGTVDLAFSTVGITVNSSAASDFQLVIDTDGDGDFSNSTVSKVATSFANNVVTFTGITAAELADNAVFTFIVGIAAGPGVLGASLWLKADEGSITSGSNLTGWVDQASLTPFSIVGTPGFQTNLFNFNPAVTFDNTDMVTDLPSSYVHGTTPITYQDGFAVYQKNSGTDGGVVIGSYTKPPGVNYGVAIFAGESPNDSYVGNGIVGNYGRFTNAKLATEIGIVNHDVSLTPSPFSTARYNGLAQTMTPTGPGFNSINFIPVIGGSKGDWKHMRGKVAEVVLYPTSLSAADKLKVESYLALKYGITLDASVVNYVNSSGTSIWNNTTYWNDVFGIGKDDASGLNQTSSNSINTGSGDGTGQSGKGNILISNPSSLDNNDFLMIGHDNGALTEFIGDLPAGLSRARIHREWKVQRTNDVGNVKMEFDFNGLPVSGGTSVLANYILLVDLDGNGNFNDGTVLQITPDAFGSPKLIFNSLTPAQLPNGAVFTFVTGPGFPLPLTLLTFEASSANCSSQVKWKTTNEVNVDRFELQVSYGNNEWTTIQTVAATNGTQDVNNYSVNYNHSNRSGNKILRLKMVDIDGKTTYSRIIGVQCGRDNVYSIYPNPASSSVTVTGTKAGDRLQVIASDGRILMNQLALDGNTQLNIESLPAGGYIIRLMHAGKWKDAGQFMKQ